MPGKKHSIPFFHPIHFFSLGLGSGLSPYAPGTVGSLLAIVIWLCFSSLSFNVHLIIIAVAFLVGIYLCDQTAKAMNCHDHKSIVWDEFVGMWIALVFLPNSTDWFGLVCAFVFFRFFDITKIWPIDWCDHKVKGGLGIMLDDVVAGLFAGICLRIIFYFI